MNKDLFCDLEVKSKDYSTLKSPEGEYENCVFRNCIFSETNLSKMAFSECIFEACNFSNAHLAGTTFQEVIFRDSKLIGLNFDQCSPFLLSFTFENCQLNFSSFFKLKLKNTIFRDCQLQQTDFSNANLSSAQFINCDLSGSIFLNTRLEKTDFSTSQNFSIDPEANFLAGAKFSTQNVQGLLNKYKIVIE